VLYLFIFIALRALRFEPGYVLLTGLAAIVGWSGLVAYAALADPTMPVTRDYVAYMYGPKILLGAEIDKLVTIGLVTAILAVALHRGRRLLVAAVREAEAAADLSRFFAPEIARQITGSERRVRPGEGALCHAAVLTTDLEGFTRLSQRLGPNEVMGLLTEYQARLVPIIRAHGGSVDKFMGDGILATFGAALPRERYAADALEAALDLVAAVAAWNRERAAGGGGGAAQPPISIGVAVAVGEVVFGAVGDEDRLEYTVIGNAVNLAAKLEKHTRREGVTAVTTADALALARRQGFVGRPGRGGEGEVRRRRIAGLDGEIELVVLAERAAA
jgi:adenylate cyclase